MKLECRESQTLRSEVYDSYHFTTIFFNLLSFEAWGCDGGRSAHEKDLVHPWNFETFFESVPIGVEFALKNRDN